MTLAWAPTVLKTTLNTTCAVLKTTLNTTCDQSRLKNSGGPRLMAIKGEPIHVPNTSSNDKMLNICKAKIFFDILF